jgi:hypothetical protein
MKMMKATFVTIIGCFVLLIGSELKAQTNWEIGARFGDINFAIDATIPLATSPRLHSAVYISDRFGMSEAISTGCLPYQEGLPD